MKLSRRSTRQRTHALPALRFEDQQLTSFSGLLLFQILFSRLRLKARLQRCVANGGAIYDRAQLLLGLVVHLLLGYRELREVRYYQDDPMVQRLLGLRTLPDVATMSRFLSDADPATVGRLRRVLRELVIERLRALGLRRVTLDFDGSVLGTGRWAEGTAVGFNRNKPGQRSYYPLFATVAQCGQVFDVLHRPGNVHDSRGAREFILACISELRAALPGVVVEVRMDGAFFSDPIVSQLQDLGVSFTLSVPFERFVQLKGQIECRRRWRRLEDGIAYFELHWKPKSWPRRLRLVVLRTEHAQRSKGPVQLDLFVPIVRDHRFTVVVTNQRIAARKVVRFHHGRGAQEGVFAELKAQGHLGYVPTRTLVGNQIYLLAVLLAHNLTRELQMAVTPPQRNTTERRTSLWPFRQLATLRGTLLHRAGRITRPQGRLTLTVSANPAVQNELLHYIDGLRPAA